MELQPKGAAALPEETYGFFSGVHRLLRYFSPAERLLLYILSLALAVSAFVLLAQVNNAVSTRVPAPGGTIVEGAIGTPRFVNPLLATTPVDQDLVMLTFSGLLRLAPDGSFEPDLAASYEISNDGTTYTFHLRQGLTFHDGTPLTADDVLYTVALAQNPEIKSPRRADWEGVSASAPDANTVVFTLPHAYAPFLENATLGILPKEHWEGVPVEEFPFQALNTHPIGSGPYLVRDVTYDATGAPEEYTLRTFKSFALGQPHITKVVYRAYQNENELMQAALDEDIDGFVVSTPRSAPRDMQEDARFMRIPLTRMFSVFFNQGHAPMLTDASVRAALDAAIDKNALVGSVLGGYGSPLTGPVPSVLLSEEAATTSEGIDHAAEARRILQNGGWTYHEASASSTEAYWTKGETTLALALATADTEDLVASAERIAEFWRAAGIRVDVQTYPLTEFNQTILRPRSYDAILFGEVIGRSLDLYPFWHSSQRNDPGLNLSLYANAEADRALSEARVATDSEERERLIGEFAKKVEADVPAIFLYSPDIVYHAPSVQGITVGPLMSPAERFASIHTWYRDTERVWDIFNK